MIIIIRKMINRTFTIALLVVSCGLLLSGCSSGKQRSQPSFSTGSSITTDSAMVVSAHPMGSEAGALILRKGGNAVDAAVATEFALAVCYPEAGNLGGGGFMLIRSSDGTARVFDYRERAPLSASRDMYLNGKGNVVDGLSTDSHLASGVPGTVDGLINIHTKYGKLPFKEVIQPAIDLAEQGFRITAGQAHDFNAVKQVFIDRNKRKPAFVKDSAWKEGDLLVQHDLAMTLERIRDHGREGFYSGPTARMIVSEMKRGHGLISMNDLSGYRSVERNPISSDYKGYKVITVPPPSGGGIILLQLLTMVDSFPVREWGFNSPETIHLITEAEKRAFADRSEYSGDPDFVKVPVIRLLDKKYLKDRMRDFRKGKVIPSAEIRPGLPEGYESEETTHYSVVDSYGNAVATTTTLNNTFGSGIVVDSAGFLLNDEMDDFSVKPGYPNMFGLVGGFANAIQPGKRMLSSMTPTIIEKNGKLFLVLGSPGGSTIPTTVFQVIINVLEFGMTVSQAVEAGRFHHQWLPDWISFENRSADSLTFQKLREMGYAIKLRQNIGSVNAIGILPDGRKAAAADRRGNNSACGY